MVVRGWPPRRRSPAEDRLLRLKRAFRRVSSRYERAGKAPKFFTLAAVAALAVSGGVWAFTSSSPIPGTSWTFSSGQLPGAITPRDERVAIVVLDGDTIRIDGRKPNVRLVGFNTPETGRRAQCKAEQDLGDAATRRLHQLVNGGTLDFHYVACACPQGTEGTDRCNYGRRCGVLKANGRDVGSILIAEGLAVPFHCYAASCPPTPRPWC
jgi:endonuclease YncB( thermonuclease family)